MAFLKGDIRILYIKISSVWLPVACLTDNPFNEATEMLQVATSTAGGWGTSIPTNQSFSIEFSGLQILTVSGPEQDKVSYDRLKVLKKSRTRIEWKIKDASGNFIDSGSGYINSISEGNEIGEYLTFSGSISGFGVPSFSSGVAYLFQDGVAFTFQDGTEFLFN